MYDDLDYNTEAPLSGAIITVKALLNTTERVVRDFCNTRTIPLDQRWKLWLLYIGSRNMVSPCDPTDINYFTHSMPPKLSSIQGTVSVKVYFDTLLKEFPDEKGSEHFDRWREFIISSKINMIYLP